MKRLMVALGMAMVLALGGLGFAPTPASAHASSSAANTSCNNTKKAGHHLHHAHHLGGSLFYDCFSSNAAHTEDCYWQVLISTGQKQPYSCS
jgi:hypothetical protein